MNGSDSENVKVILSIGGTEYEGIECLLPLNRPIRECVESFNLPRFDDGGNPLQYLLGRIRAPQLNQALSEPWQTKGSTLISPSCPT